MHTTQNRRWRDLTPEQRASLPVGTTARIDPHGCVWTLGATCWQRFSPFSPDLTDCAEPPAVAFVQLPVCMDAIAAMVDGYRALDEARTEADDLRDIHIRETRRLAAALGLPDGEIRELREVVDEAIRRLAAGNEDAPHYLTAQASGACTVGGSSHE